MQFLTIAGYLSRDAEQRTTQRGDAVTTWNVPVKQGWGDTEQTNWYRVSVWGKRADFAAKLKKGDHVTVTGPLTIGDYNGKPQYEISASDFQSVKMGPREARQGGGGDGWTGEVNRNFPDAEALDDSIPFATRNSIW